MPTSIRIRPGMPTYQPNRTPDSSRVMPRALTAGQYELGGMWIGPVIWLALSAASRLCGCHSGSRLSTRGIDAKLYDGGGDGIAHSSVAPPHGSLPAGGPL